MSWLWLLTSWTSQQYEFRPKLGFPSKVEWKTKNKAWLIGCGNEAHNCPISVLETQKYSSTWNTKDWLSMHFNGKQKSQVGKKNLMNTLPVVGSVNKDMTLVIVPREIIWKTRRCASCKNINYSPTHNFKSRDASASKNIFYCFPYVANG